MGGRSREGVSDISTIIIIIIIIISFILIRKRFYLSHIYKNRLFRPLLGYPEI